VAIELLANINKVLEKHMEEATDTVNNNLIMCQSFITSIWLLPIYAYCIMCHIRVHLICELHLHSKQSEHGWHFLDN
jgi:heme/copper-type cytochrome/quinol oxidase subunit 4